MLADIQVIEAPSVYPVTLQEAKNFSKVEYTDDDDILNMQIRSATQKVEQYLSRTLINTRLKATFSMYEQTIYLPKPPVSTVHVVMQKYRNTDTILTEGEDYFVRGGKDKFVLLDKFPSVVGLPERERQFYGELTIEYTAGYGAAADDVPEAIKEAILKIIETNYLYRGNVVTGQSQIELNNNAFQLIAEYRNLSIA